MNKNSKWLMAVGMAAMITANGIAMAAVASDKQEVQNDKSTTSISSHRAFREHTENRAALLQLLKMDAKTFKAERMADKSLLDIATKQGISEKQLTDFLVSQQLQRLDEGVRSGRISEAKAAELKANTESRVAKMIHQRGHKARHHNNHNKELLALLKMDEQTFKQERAQGKSLVTIASERGVSEQQLKDFYTDMIAKRIEKGVKEGRISPEKAETMKAKAMEHMEQFLTKSPVRTK